MSGYRGAGCIGANLMRRLVAQAMHIRVLGNLSTGRRDDLAELPVEFIQGDIRDTKVVFRAVNGIQAVIYLAAHTNIVESAKTPELNLDTNAPWACGSLQFTAPGAVRIWQCGCFRGHAPGKNH
jgi:UDP-glucose 4-epimerase